MFSYIYNNLRLHIPALGIVMLSACSGKPAQQIPSPAANSSAVTLSKTQIQNAGIRSGHTDTTQIESELLLNGTVEAPPSHKISISFPLGAVVKNIRVLPGEKVRKGQQLFRLESVQIAEMQRSYLSSEALCTQLEAEVQRQNEMMQNNASSEKQRQEAQTRLLSEKAAREALRQQLALLGISTGGLNASGIRSYVDVSAPVTGYITQVWANEGMYIDAGKEILVMINPDDIHISLQAFENHIPFLQEKQQVQFFSNNDPSATFSGTIIGISREIGSDRSFAVHCHINDTRMLLIPGMYMNAKVTTASALVNALPNAALVKSGDDYLAFSDEGNGTYTEHKIKTGISGEAYTQVILPPGLENKKWVKNNAYTLWLSLHNKAGED